MKTVEVNFRTTPEIKAAAVKAAALDRRTLSSLIEWLLATHCEEVGTLKPGRRSRPKGE